MAVTGNRMDKAFLTHGMAVEAARRAEVRASPEGAVLQRRHHSGTCSGHGGVKQWLTN